MSELVPQFTYSPEGVFNIRTTMLPGIPDDNSGRRQEWHVDRLVEDFGADASIADTLLTIDVDIAESLGQYFNNSGDPDIENFLRIVDKILPLFPQDQIDRVVGLENLWGRNANGIVYPRFQAYLNEVGLDENATKEGIAAMALPFGKDMVMEANKDFKVYANTAQGRSFRFALIDDDFGLTRLEETEETVIVSTGEASWNWLDISTLGDCACWGAVWTEREDVVVEDGSKRLYEMSVHNIDFARQALSLVLGIGSLTLHAASFDGDSDIFRDVDWKREERPKAC